MVLDIEKVKIIQKMIYERPRCVDEIAKKLKVNWRTADRYVQEINTKTGDIATFTFRRGTQGALKVVYWVNRDTVSTSRHQDRLLNVITNGIAKTDFSPFEVYQFVQSGMRHAFLDKKDEKKEYYYFRGSEDIANFLSNVKDEVLSFSGGLDWINLEEYGTSVLKTLEKLAKKGVEIKILARVDFDSIDNVYKLWTINNKLGKDVIEIRHRYQPIRGAIIDEKVLRLTETTPKVGIESKVIFYEILDNEWVEWMKDIFWKMFQESIPAEKRIEDLKTVHRLKKI